MNNYLHWAKEQSLKLNSFLEYKQSQVKTDSSFEFNDLKSKKHVDI